MTDAEGSSQPPVATNPTDHGDCAAFLKAGAARHGLDVTVSPFPLNEAKPYVFTCPHGTHFWIAPTGAQLAEWACPKGIHLH